MKPETIARRKIARLKETAARRENLRDRLKRAAERDGPDSIWAEMLAELREA